jgi:hypothetical protein
MTKIPCLVILASIVSGCVYMQHGDRFDAEKVNSFQAGITTEQDAITALGKPMARSINADGSELLQWQYVYGTAIGVGGGSHAAVLFGANGRMLRVTMLSQQ